VSRHGNGAEASFNIPSPAPVSRYPAPKPGGEINFTPRLAPNRDGFPGTAPTPTHEKYRKNIKKILTVSLLKFTVYVE